MGARGRRKGLCVCSGYIFFPPVDRASFVCGRTRAHLLFAQSRSKCVRFRSGAHCQYSWGCDRQQGNQQKQLIKSLSARSQLYTRRGRCEMRNNKADEQCRRFDSLFTPTRSVPLSRSKVELICFDALASDHPLLSAPVCAHSAALASLWPKGLYMNR